MDRKKVLEIIENNEWARLKAIAEFELKQKQVKLNDLFLA
mgnify:CR=1 FL=1